MNLEQHESSAFDSLLQFEEEVLIDSKVATLIGIDYSDKYFITISSNGKIGTILTASSTQNINTEGELIFTYSAKTLFGIEEPLLEVFVRNLCEKLRKNYSINKPLVLAIGVSKDQLNINSLRQYENTILKSIRK